jgi:hypothetical protein
MVTQLELRASAKKIKKTVEEGKKIFNSMKIIGDERYVWIDTCCINKSVVGEHVESLAMMEE